MSRGYVKGIVYLLDWSGQIIAGKQYLGKTERHKIIEQWGRLYSASFKRCYIQVAPVMDDFHYRARKLYEFGGAVRSLRGWADEYGIKYTTLKLRVKFWGFGERALTETSHKRLMKVNHGGETLTIQQWADRTGITTQSIYARIRSGWNPQAAVSTTPRKFKKFTGEAA